MARFRFEGHVLPVPTLHVQGGSTSDRDGLTRSPENGLNLWWEKRTTLEKIGVSALVVAGGAVAAVVIFPHAAAAAGGGALTASGAYLLKKGFGG